MKQNNLFQNPNLITTHLMNYKAKVTAVQFDGSKESASVISQFLNGAEVSIGDGGELVLPKGHKVQKGSFLGFNEANRTVSVIPEIMFNDLFTPDAEAWEGDPDHVIAQTFFSAVKAAKAGRLIRRKAWPEGMFVIAQVPSTVPTEIIPKMSSLPADAKAVFVGRGKPIHYSDQYAVVYADNEINGWIPGHHDMANNDWEILPVSNFDLPAAPVAETAGTAVPDKELLENPAAHCAD